MLREKLKTGFAQLPFLLRSLGFVWRAAGSWTIAWVVLLVLQGLLPVASVYLTRWIVNALVLVIDRTLSWESARLVLLPGLLYGLVLLLSAMMNSLTAWIRTAQAERVQDHISALIHKKSSDVDLAFYDTPEFYDRLHRARTDASYRPVALLESIGSLIQNGITMISMVLLLFQFGVWVPAALIVSTLPVLYVVLQHRSRLYQWRLRTTADERKTWYYDWLLSARETAAELRIFRLGGYFQGIHQDLREKLRQERTDLARRESLAEFGASVLSLVVTFIALGWMLLQTIAKQYTLGDLAFFYQAFIQGQTLVRSFLNNAGEIYSNSLFLSDLFAFLELAPSVTDPSQPVSPPERLQQGIKFENVTFHYPGSDRPALNDFNLHIAAGEIAAIVGPNGAGKSTLIRLLCRFYDPQVGDIRLDGINLRDFTLKDLQRVITVLFQDPVQYFATAGENIALGDLAAKPDFKQIESAAEAAGADTPISNLPSGYDTLLGKWFAGGADLSVGEWQRIALARAFLRQAPIIILDEPTSAMDPWGEADWLRRFRAISASKTTILITHRFTTASHADRIYVMENGKIVETGTHTELINAGGQYAQSWNAQVQTWLSTPS